MKIIDNFTVSRRGDMEHNEDAIVVTDNFACVFDGATRINGMLWNGQTCGKIATILLSDAAKSLPKTIDGESAIELFTARIARFYDQNNVYETMCNDPSKRLTASIIVYSRHKREIWRVGDCQFMIDDQLFSNRLPLEAIISSARSLFLNIELSKGKSLSELMQNDTGREFIEPLLKGKSVFQNSCLASPYSYGAIDGFKVPKNQIEIVSINASVKHLVLASDGYPVLKPTLKESEQMLAEILVTDPMCIWNFMATKGKTLANESFDDRAFLKLSV